MDIKEFISEMNSVPHVSGYEGALVKVISDAFSPYADVSVDKFGNIVARKCSCVDAADYPKIMLCAHMDEIGMMVSAICANGFVKFTQIGGIDARNMLAQEVTIYGREKVYGVIGIKPPHITTREEANKAVGLHDMAIDTGYSEEKLRTLIRPGDIITINQNIAELQNGRIAGKALDNMAGVAVMYQVMKNLEHFDNLSDIYYVASAQEEVGLRGAVTAAYTIKPDIGIAIDVEFGRSEGVGEHESIELGKGPGVTIGPNINRKLFEALKQAAVDNNTPHQVLVAPHGSGTDAFAIQISGCGVATGLVSIPLKYMHSTVEMAALSDIKNCARLISDYIISINNVKSAGLYRAEGSKNGNGLNCPEGSNRGKGLNCPEGSNSGESLNCAEGSNSEKGGILCS